MPRRPISFTDVEHGLRLQAEDEHGQRLQAEEIELHEPAL
jgi:hypothetical protein